MLVEGPRSFDPLIPLLTDESARSPLAIYTYAVGRASGDEPPPRHAAYYPFCDYSPELVALRLARELSVPVRFIDLDFAEQCQIQTQQHEEEARSLMSMVVATSHPLPSSPINAHSGMNALLRNTSLK